MSAPSVHAPRRAEGQARALDALRAGATRRSACRLAGVSRAQFYIWLDRDSAFARRVVDAEEEAIRASMPPEEWVAVLGTALREGAPLDDLRAIARAIPAATRARVLEALDHA